MRWWACVVDERNFLQNALFFAHFSTFHLLLFLYYCSLYKLIAYSLFEVFHVEVLLLILSLLNYFFLLTPISIAHDYFLSYYQFQLLFLQSITQFRAV